MNFKDICSLCKSGLGSGEHAVLVALSELDTGNGVTEDEIQSYYNEHLVHLTLDDLHIRLAAKFDGTVN